MRMNCDHQDATKERLAHAGEAATVGADGVRYLANSPLQRLANRGELSLDKAMNIRLLDAGERYYRDWYLSGMCTLAAQDISREGRGEEAARACQPVKSRRPGGRRGVMRPTSSVTGCAQWSTRWY